MSKTEPYSGVYKSTVNWVNYSSVHEYHMNRKKLKDRYYFFYFFFSSAWCDCIIISENFNIIYLYEIYTGAKCSEKSSSGYLKFYKSHQKPLLLNIIIISTDKIPHKTATN